jgi:cell division protease FtsH
MARAVVMRYGMDDKVGLVSYDAERHELLPGVLESPGERRYSERTAWEIDCAVRELVLAAFETATSVLTRARCVLDRGARALLEKESLGEDELAELKLELIDRLRVPAAVGIAKQGAVTGPGGA